MGACVVRIVFVMLFVWLFATTANAGQSDLDDQPMVVSGLECKAAFKRYSNAWRPVHFALSADSKACAFSYCIGACRVGHSDATVLKLCQHDSNGSPCEIYAYRGSIVSKRAGALDGTGDD